MPSLMDVDQVPDLSLQGTTKAQTLASPLRTVEGPDGAVAFVAQPAAVTSNTAKMPNKRNRKTNAMPPSAPAVTVIKGFETPRTPIYDDSDVSRAASPLIRPSSGGIAMSRTTSAQSGISILKQQLDALALEDANNGLRLVRTNSNLGSEFGGSEGLTSAASDSDRTETDTYEVPLEHDFVSSEVVSVKPSPRLGPVEGGLRNTSIHRKMTAADFQPLRCLGKGAFGTVFLVKQHATGRLYAQKQFRKASLTIHKRLVEQTRTERNILESVNRHPFVVKLFYAFQDQEKLYLILEYALGGELFTHLAMEKMFSEEVSAFYMAEMVLALEHLQFNVRVVYRDLKPENCLLDAEGHLLLTDFGLSKVAIEEDGGAPCNSILGTVEYMAPEVVQGIDYGMAVDWWSLGAIGFDMLTGAPPFAGANNAKIQHNIVRQKLQLPYFLGPDAKDLLTRLLRKDPAKRLGYNMPKDLATIKAHRFFRRIDWAALERRELTPPIRPLVTDPELAENFAKEFTALPLRQTVDRAVVCAGGEGEGVKGSNPFEAFSFVASSSLLERAYLMEE